MIISHYVGMSDNKAIGFKNKLLWNIPEDLKKFKEITKNHHVIMGKNTYKSIGRPLPLRTNIVLSNSLKVDNDRVIVMKDLSAGLELARNNNESECFIIGGACLYEQSFELIDRLYLSIVHETFKQVDTFYTNKFDFDNFTILKHIEYKKIIYGDHYIPAWDFFVLQKS